MGGRPADGGQTVGSAQGRIGIDTSGVVTAERQVNQSSQVMTQSLNKLNSPLANVAQYFQNAKKSADEFGKSNLGQIQQGIQGLASSLAPLSAIGGVITAGGLAAARSVQSINTRFSVFLGSTKAAQAELTKIRQMADETGQPFLELADSAAQLLSLSKAQNVEVGKLVTLSQQLKAVDPTARALDVSIATREFLSGNARSLVARFEGLDKKTLEDILESSTTAADRLDKLQGYLNKLGFSTEILKKFGKEGAFAFDTLRSEVTEALGTAFMPLLQNFVLPGAKALSGFVRGLRETNPELLQFGSIAAVAAAGAAPLLLVASQLITAFKNIKTLGGLGGLGNLAKGGLAVGGGLLLGSVAAKGLANAGVTTGDLGRVAKGEDPLAIVGERLKQGLVVFVDLVLNGAKPIVQGFAFVGSLVNQAGKALEKPLNDLKNLFEQAISKITNAFGTILVQIANLFSGLFDTSDLRKAGQDQIQKATDQISQSLAEAGSGLADPLSIAAQAAVDAGNAFDQTHKDIVTSLSQGLGLVPVEQAAEEASTSLDKVTEAANPLAEAFKANQEKLQEAANQIIEARKKFNDENKKQNEERGISAAREEFDFNLQRARANRDFNQQMAQQDADFYRSRERSIADFNKTIQSEVLAEQQQEAKQRAEFAEQLVRDAEDHGRRLAEIEKNTHDSVRKAASQLDAIGAQDALDSGQQQLDSENSQYALAQKRRQEDFDKQLAEQAQNAQKSRDQQVLQFQQQLADSQAQHDDQRQRDLAAYALRQQDEDIDRAMRLSRQQEDYARQDAARKQALRNQETDIINALAKETGIRRQWVASFVSSLVSAGNHVKDFAAFVNQTVANLPHAETAPKPGQIAPTQFASGGQPPYVKINERGLESAVFSDGMFALLTRPATIIPAQQTAALLGGRGGGGVNIQNFNPQLVFGDIGKYQPQQIEEIAINAMSKAFAKLKEKTG